MPKDRNYFEEIKSSLVPRGASDTIRLYFENPFFNGSFVRECIKEAEKICSTRNLIEQPITPLEKLAIYVLMDSAGVELARKF